MLFFYFLYFMAQETKPTRYSVNSYMVISLETSETDSPFEILYLYSPEARISSWILVQSLFFSRSGCKMNLCIKRESCNSLEGLNSVAVKQCGWNWDVFFLGFSVDEVWISVGGVLFFVRAANLFRMLLLLNRNLSKTVVHVDSVIMCVF